MEILNIDVIVNFKKSREFCELIKGKGEIINTTELIKNDTLMYSIRSNSNNYSLIKEIAFMSFVKNLKFQKYYKI